MTTASKNISRADFSPHAFGLDDIAMAYLIDRMMKLPKDAASDLASLGEDIAKCKDQDTYIGILETMKEIIFPELIGKVRYGSAGSPEPTEKYQKYKDFIGGKIEELRKNAGMTQEALAEKSGLTQSHVSRLELGQHSPSRKTLEKIALALEVDVNVLDPCR
jgi:DNA-binding XRE family transcriptional regulator